ncbi:YlxR family protein [Mycoplasmopsis cynos]|nr:YlxR family protein [Mycoplasmopsis cynos]UWV81335.1 YlxR family protein [Mycoplasmopsis cynos]
MKFPNLYDLIIKRTNILKIDWNKNMNGRGAYFVPEKQNWEKIKKQEH